MAKVLLYGVARRGDEERAIAAARAMVDDCSVEVDQHPTLSLMVPLADDPFTMVPGVQHVAPTFALEIAQPLGQLLEPLLAMLQPRIDALLEVLDRDATQVLAGYHRALTVEGRNRLVYHYLMQKKAGFRRADYLDYYMNSHYQFGIATPGIDYYQTYRDAEFSAELAQRWHVAVCPAENVSEMHMNDIDEVAADSVTVEVGRRAIADEEVFVDRASSRMFTMALIVRRTL